MLILYKWNLFSKVYSFSIRSKNKRYKNWGSKKLVGTKFSIRYWGFSELY